MIKNISKKLIAIIAVILAIGGAILFKSKLADNFGGQIQLSPSPTDAGALPSVQEKEQLLADLKSAAEKEDYFAFADLLKKVYDKGWEKEKDFESAESEAYVKADKNYFTVGNYGKALEISTIVYDKAPFGWRFAYLRVITLEKMGRIALEKGDIANAEKNALVILSMTFRPEGANLLADVYISKIKTNIKDGNTVLAKQNLGFIWDYEVSQDRRDTLTDLKKQIGQ